MSTRFESGKNFRKVDHCVKIRNVIALTVLSAAVDEPRSITVKIYKNLNDSRTGISGGKKIKVRMHDLLNKHFY